MPVLNFDDKSKKKNLSFRNPGNKWQLGKALIPLEPCVGQSFAKDSISVKTMSGRTLHLHLFFNRSDQPVLWLLTAVLHEVTVH